jgi:hypothetical protein
MCHHAGRYVPVINSPGDPGVITDLWGFQGPILSQFLLLSPSFNCICFENLFMNVF